MATYNTSATSFSGDIGTLVPEDISKLLIACQNAIKEQYPVAGSKNIFYKVHTKGEYGAYRLTIQQLVDAGWLGPNTIEYVNNLLVDHPEGPEKLENRKSYYENAKEVFGKELDFAEATIESKNSAQYYFITTILEGIATKNNIKTGSEILFSESIQDSIAYNYLTFIYNLLTAARVITPQTEMPVVAGLLSVALCVNFDTALSYSRGIIKKDTNGITSKYWYDIGWNSVSTKPLKISIPKPNLPNLPLVSGGATSAETVIDKVKVEYSIVGQSIAGKIFYDNVEIASSMPATVNSLTKQLDKIIQLTRIVGPKDKFLALQSFKEVLTKDFDTSVAPLKKQLNVTDPIVTANTDGDGNRITSSITVNPDGTKTTVVETIDAAGNRSKETTQEKVVLETKTQEVDVTDPPESEVPNAADDESVNTSNSTNTYRANNQPFNTDSLPPEQQDETKGFKDPHSVYPLKTSVNKPDTNPLATGVNSESVVASPATLAGDRESMSAGASPLARNATRKREVQTAGRNGATWSQPTSPYAAQYPYNKVFGSEAGHAIEIDDSPGAERLNWAHRSGTFDEISPDGTKVTKIVGDGYTILDKNGFIMIEGIANVHVAGNCNVIIMSDTNLTMHGRVSMDIHNDVDVNIAGRLSLSVGEGIYARNGGPMSVENIGNIDIDAKGDVTKDVVGSYNITTESGMNVTSKADTHIKTSGEFYNHSTGDTNFCTDAAIKTKSGAATEIKSGAAVNVESTGDTNIKSGGALNTEAAGNTSLKAAKVLSSAFNAPTIDVSTLNAASTNLRATGTDTGTNGGSTHNLPVAGSASVAQPASAGSASDAVCAEPAPLPTIKTVEKPVSRSVSSSPQVVGQNSSVGGGSSLPDDTSFDTPEEAAAASEACKNGAGVDETGQVSGSGEGATNPNDPGVSGSPLPPGVAPTTCNLYYKTKQPMPALRMSGPLSDNIRLSDNYVLRDIVACTMKTRSVSDIRDYRRNGKTIFTKWDIVQNYRCLFLNIIEPLRAKYPGFVINSGFRETDTAHGYAAVDLQWPKYLSDRKKMKEIGLYVVNNFAFDQVFIERASAASNKAWLHIGYKYYTGAQRGEYYTASADEKPSFNISKSKRKFVDF